MSDYVGITGRWNARPAAPEVLSLHLARCLSALVEIDPLFQQWRRIGARSLSAVPAFITLPLDHSELQTWIAENPEFGTRDGRKQTIGYSLVAEAPRGRPLWSRLSIYTSNVGKLLWFDNRVAITLFAESGHEASLAPLVRPVLLALATGFGCDWAATDNANYATPKGQQAGADLLRYESGGMVYLTAPVAARVTPPTDIGIEYFPDGSLLMTSASVFDRKNPHHLAAAHLIQVALAPLNAESEAGSD